VYKIWKVGTDRRTDKVRKVSFILRISCHDFIHRYNFNTILTTTQLLLDVWRFYKLFITIYLLLSVQFSIYHISSQNRRTLQCCHNSNKTAVTCGTLQLEQELWPELW